MSWRPILKDNLDLEHNMKVAMNTAELNEFSAKVDILESKGYDLSFTVDKTAKDQYNVEILGEHNAEELDRLTENG